MVQEIQKGLLSANYLTGLVPDNEYARTTSKTTENLSHRPARQYHRASPVTTGSIETTYTYGPFGTTTREGTASENPIQYTGEEDEGNGLYYYRARYYSPTAARFLSQDPTGQEGSGPNLYLYTDDGPTNATDPYGTSIKPPSPTPPGGEGGEGGEGGSEGAGAGEGAGGAGSASAGGPGAHGSQPGCNPGSLKGNGLGGGGDWLRCPNEEDLERLNQEERDKENEEGGESEGDKIDDGVQKVCDLSGPTPAVALRKAPAVGSVVLVGCVGFTAGNLVRQGLGF